VHRRGREIDWSSSQRLEGRQSRSTRTEVHQQGCIVCGCNTMTVATCVIINWSHLWRSPPIPIVTDIRLVAYLSWMDTLS
jgi:hypothetical protein